jgi:hypothetical protein
VSIWPVKAEPTSTGQRGQQLPPRTALSCSAEAADVRGGYDEAEGSFLWSQQNEEKKRGSFTQRRSASAATVAVWGRPRPPSDCRRVLAYHAGFLLSRLAATHCRSTFDNAASTGDVAGYSSPHPKSQCNAGHADVGGPLMLV